MTGEEKAREVAANLKNKAGATKSEDKTEIAQVKGELSTLESDPALAKMYQDNAEVGAKNLTGELPLLKIFSTGKSTAELKDGKEPENGAFFYKPLQSQFDAVTCHVLTISRGFRAEGMKDSSGKTEAKFNQVMGGVIVDGDDMLPFVMYFTGLKLSNLWEFGKEASKYTKMKPVPIPMFAMTVKMGSEQVKSDYGKVWIANFEIVKDDNGFPVVVRDPALFETLKMSVVAIEETIASLIDTKSVEEEHVQRIESEPVPEDVEPY